MRTSEILKTIKNDPKLYLAYLKSQKLSGKVSETRSGKLWIFHSVKKGIDSYTVYNLNDKIIKRGVSK